MLLLSFRGRNRPSHGAGACRPVAFPLPVRKWQITKNPFRENPGVPKRNFSFCLLWFFLEPGRNRPCRKDCTVESATPPAGILSRIRVPPTPLQRIESRWGRNGSRAPYTGKRDADRTGSSILQSASFQRPLTLQRAAEHLLYRIRFYLGRSRPGDENHVVAGLNLRLQKTVRFPQYPPATVPLNRFSYGFGRSKPESVAVPAVFSQIKDEKRRYHALSVLV